MVPLAHPTAALLGGPCVAALDLRGGERILDATAGCGILARTLARAAPGVRVVAVEADPAQRALGGRLARAAGEDAGIEIRAAERPGELPLTPAEWGSFDLGIATFVGSRSPAPERILPALSRAVRPGRRIALIDEDLGALRARPAVGGLAEIAAVAGRALARSGDDLGRRLPAALAAAGLTCRDRAELRLDSRAGEARFEVLAAGLVDALRNARGSLLADGALAPGRFDAIVAELEQWRRDPRASLRYRIRLWLAARAPSRGFTLTP
jgi:SAM-dependent methyltransferase